MMKIICITPVKHLDDVYENMCKFGEVVYKPEISREELIDYLQNEDVDWIFTNPNKQNFLLDESILKFSNLKGINTASTGLNHIDVLYCTHNNIKVVSHKDDMELLENLPSTSELAFGLMLSLLRNIPSGFDDVKKGNWDYEPFVGHQIKGKVIGVIGYGRLGKIMCELFNGWGVEVLAVDPYVDVWLGHNGFDLQYTLSNSDVVFLHTHVTDETRGMVDEEFLSYMKEGSYLINTSRGELVDEQAIIESIRSGHLKGYGTDVIKDEFGDYKGSKLVEFSKKHNVIITPHVGGMTHEGSRRAYLWAVRKFKTYKTSSELRSMKINKFSKKLIKKLVKKQEFDVLLDLDGCDLIKVDNWIFKKIRKINARFQYIGQFIGQDRVMRIWTQ